MQLRERWHSFREQNPKTRIREAASHLGVTEAQLLATGCGTTVTRLAPPWGELVKGLSSLGRVMVLTRNEQAVHEKTGCFEEVQVTGPMGLVLGPDIDLRLFLSRWRMGFSVREQGLGGIRRSLQFFNGSGMAVMKVYLQPEGSVEAFRLLQDRFASDDQSPTQAVEDSPSPSPAGTRPDSEVDVTELRARWGTMKDTHDFVGLLHRLELGRVQALRLAGQAFAEPVSPGAFPLLLETASREEVPIMVFVGNEGAIQIHTGPVLTIRPLGAWINVLDEGFNLHVRQDQVASAWVVRKPTVDGMVTSLELFAADETLILQVFGKRKPGTPEDPRWRSLVGSLNAS